MTKISALCVGVGSLAWLVVGCGRGLDGNGQRVDELRETATFTRLRSDCDLDVQVVQGERQSLTVSIDSNLQDVVTTRVDHDTLFIDEREDIDAVVIGPQVVVTVPRLSAAELAGSGSMTLVLDQAGSPLDLFLSGSGSMRFDGTTPALGALLEGSGDIRLVGQASNVTMTLSGSGSIRARDLDASKATIDLSGSGDVSATVHDSANVSLSGSGRIDLYGGATLDQRRNTGSGDIVQH